MLTRREISFTGGTITEIEPPPAVWSRSSNTQLLLANGHATWTIRGTFKLPRKMGAPGHCFWPGPRWIWRLNERKYDRVLYSYKQRYGRYDSDCFVWFTQWSGPSGCKVHVKHGNADIFNSHGFNNIVSCAATWLANALLKLDFNPPGQS